MVVVKRWWWWWWWRWWFRVRLNRRGRRRAFEHSRLREAFEERGLRASIWKDSGSRATAPCRPWPRRIHLLAKGLGWSTFKGNGLPGTGTPYSETVMLY